MTTYIISYDKAGGEDYEPLYEAIKAYGTWARITESTWAVATNLKAKNVRDDLAQYLPPGSRLFVIKSGVEAAWKNVICNNEWLKQHL